MEQRRKRKRNEEHVNNFISNSTLHGLHFCFDKKHLIRRIIWTLILVGAFGYVGEKIYASLVQFFQYPMSTTTTLVYDEQNINLPAISICNLNDFRRSKFENTLLAKTFISMDFSKINGSVYRDTVLEANHRLSDMLVDITVNRKAYNASSFVEYWDRSGTTRCYTFNSGKNENILSVNLTGPNNGIEVVLDIQQYDYYDTTQAGIKLVLHGQEETPVKVAGMLLMPGTLTHIEIAKRRVRFFNCIAFIKNCVEVSL